MKPSIAFFVIGAARSGTTSLYDALSGHPQIFVPTLKEPRFFKENWSKGWDWYSSLYQAAADDALAGDFSPSYSNATGRNFVADRIWRSYPRSRIVYLVRNPIDCAISNWRMTAENLGQSIEFGLALTHKSWITPVLERVRYFHQLSEYRRLFADEQILVMPLEAVLEESGAWMERVQRHVGVACRPLEFMKSNASNRKPRRPSAPDVPKPARQAFVDLLGDDWRRLLDHLGLPATFWDVSASSPAWERAE